MLNVYDVMPKAFKDALSEPYVTDLAMHDNGHGYITRFTGDTDIGDIRGYVPLMLCLAASHEGKVINSQKPELQCKLPNGERLTGWRPEVGGRYNVTIRVPMKRRLSWDEMVSFGTLSYEVVDWIEKKIGEKASIALVGEMSSGKTHFLSTMLGSTHLSSKVCAKIETVEELIGPDKCKTLLISDSLSFEKARELLMRATAKVVIMGEARTPEEMAEVMTTAGSGHQSFTTFHAKGISEAPYRIEDLLRRGGYTHSREDIHGNIARNFDYFIFMRQQEDGKRVVADIASLEMKDGVAVRKSVDGIELGIRS